MILASRSPRRKELLASCGVEFSIYDANVEELTADSPVALEELPGCNALLKARSVAGMFPSEMVLGADTMVICDGMALGKPESLADSFRMLKMLSGQDHKVITAVSIRDYKRIVTFSDTAIVSFKSLTDNEIYFYIDNFKPFDKAGAYGIQEWIGYMGIGRIEGSYFTIMGLPVHLVYQELLKFIG
jgi:septum formation protein